MDRVTVYRDRTGQWRWRRKALNNKIVSESGEGYTNKQDCIDMATKVNQDIKFIQVLGGTRELRNGVEEVFDETVETKTND